jgi:hypothetical protein
MIIHQTSSESYVIFAVGPLRVNHMIVDLAMKNRTPLKIAVLAGRPAFEVAALSNCRFASSRPVTAHEFAPAIDADLVQKRALVLLRPARLACRNLRLPSLLAPFALFFFPSGRKALGTSARPGEIALSLKNKSNSSSAVPAGQRRAIELQSFGAGNCVFETKAEKPHEREAVAKTVFRPIAGKIVERLQRQRLEDRDFVPALASRQIFARRFQLGLEGEKNAVPRRNPAFRA